MNNQKYVLVAEKEASKLTARVNYYLSRGWRQWGSPMFNPDTSQYAQAVIKQ